MFLTLEGIEGSGKTTQVSFIERHLRGKGHDCLITKEPGGTVIGGKIRSILLDPDHHTLDPMAELLLYTADRAQHVSERIRPALAAGKTVICDRFYDSTIVYQGAARGIDPGIILELNRLVLGDIKPDITFLLDLPPETGLSRAWRELRSGNRDNGESRFEREKLLFHQKVREGYHRLAAADPERIRVIDAAASPEDVSNVIILELDRFLAVRKVLI